MNIWVLDVANRAADPDQVSTLFTGMAYAYVRTFLLATKEQAKAFINPDNYRVFAEMSMAHPKTRWAAPNPNDPK